jgi:hypothetical protein
MEISRPDGLYSVEGIVSSGTSIENVPLDPAVHSSSIQALYVRDPNGNIVSDFELTWEIVLAAQNALLYTTSGETDLTDPNSRPIMFDGLYRRL